ncbi:hypothetical protein, partial [Enterobacter intestinihominis]
VSNRGGDGHPQSQTNSPGVGVYFYQRTLFPAQSATPQPAAHRVLAVSYKQITLPTTNLYCLYWWWAEH